MKRVIVDYEKLTSKVLNLLVEKFPDGYDYEDIISFNTNDGSYVKAVEVRTDDTIYLVKISSQLVKTMERYFLDEENNSLDIIDD
ncbi:hypothetical protein [uncultured Tenacibaculum sp.]|uniref:hypothetical protein n=1 Tax=uncultured Tenacibaculum sp. TaxID=174713 RepID=UPI00260260D6|nr:hypothetical protein [uncultured Tenacibaculum sp.]